MFTELSRPLFFVDESDPLPATLKGVVDDPGACSQSVLCQGQDGLVRCDNLVINRAGTYFLEYRFPAGCPLCTKVVTPIESAQFSVSRSEDGIKFLSMTCQLCNTPTNTQQPSGIPEICTRNVTASPGVGVTTLTGFAPAIQL